MLMTTPSRVSTAVKAALVNCEPWSLLKISGLPWWRKASSRQSTQNTASMLLPDPPAEHPPRVPVNDRHQIDEAAWQPDVGDIRAPDLVWPDHGNPAQQIGIDLVLRVRPARVGTRRHPRQPHLAHQASYPLAIDEVTHRLEKDHHLAAAVKRVPGVLFVDQATDQQIAFIDRLGLLLRIDRGARDAGQNALPNDGYRICSVDPPVPDHGRLIPDFFLSQSSSIFNLPISLQSHTGRESDECPPCLIQLATRHHQLFA